MSTNTPNIDLKKINTSTDGNNTFNIDTYLNDNWDKIDSELSPTINPVIAPTGNQGLVKTLLGGIANRIKAITGKTNWWDTPTKSLEQLSTDKVDKISGKGLSTNDFDADYKTKIDGIATNANNYTHPTNHGPLIITQDASNRFVSDAEKNTWNAKETITGSQAKVDALQSVVNAQFANKVSALAKYRSIDHYDPNTTEEDFILTLHANNPIPGMYAYIRTYFYSSRVGNRSQIATSYSGGNNLYTRQCYGSVWTAWTRMAQTADNNFVMAVGGTANAIIITKVDAGYIDGMPITFIAKYDSTATITISINGAQTKFLYKPNTTTSPTLIAGKAYTIWYSTTSNVFFIKASAEGNVTADKVLAGYTFSNDTDTGLVGTAEAFSSNMAGGTYNSGYPTFTISNLTFTPNHIIVFKDANSIREYHNTTRLTALGITNPYQIAIDDGVVLTGDKITAINSTGFTVDKGAKTGYYYWLAIKE